MAASGSSTSPRRSRPLASRARPCWPRREAARFAEHGGAGVALRFGQFYGFDSGHTVRAIEAALAGLPVELGAESAYRSSVTTDDAASAVMAALDAPSGVYNVVDDRPLPRGEYVDALADALGVPSPTGDR